MNYQRVVIKVGSSTLTAGGRHISPPRVIDLVKAICQLKQSGIQVLLVSSGAIAAGREALGYPELPKFIPAKQMLAAIGQPRLMEMYERFFAIYEEKVAQVLLTRADLTDRRRYLNARSTLEALIHQSVIPIINENDTVATEEIRFGDNDNLSAQVASLIEADLLILLTDQDGVYDQDPRRNPHARLFGRIESAEIPPEMWAAAGGSVSGVGTGGMITKLQAADLARRSGCAVVVASGSVPLNILRIVNNEPIGTYFSPVLNKIEARKRYILTAAKGNGQIYIDAGAELALIRGRSLLPIGITKVSGDFERGDAVEVLCGKASSVAMGITNYAARDLEKLIGHQSTEIETILGYTYGDEVIHRNNLVMIQSIERNCNG
ncbi:glutamate 5-kinase [Bellilinea caldifistulae]|uniref:Glutamate 5-kinase n=1 Tax=Bellilinea caldifistulae TaxID=360411 RepID=A0A0P6XXD8_9CHLR|nr:glutamate 5-kinase [Bellilinea caldifistulae]KPL78054.1 gamma-glutamyl kinase [Bellilinea caldifistulae]GAP10746.1 glutamate 5-kinase [Bellilinea caldifistulae]